MTVPVGPLLAPLRAPGLVTFIGRGLGLRKPFGPRAAAALITVAARFCSVCAGALRLLTNLLAGFPTAKVRTVDGFITISQATINTLLNLFYVLLALSVIISLFGILSTLALSIVERTREIGALRAIGIDPLAAAPHDQG